MTPDIKNICNTAKDASRKMALIGPAIKDEVLRAMAKALVENTFHIIEENEKDIAAAERA